MELKRPRSPRLTDDLFDAADLAALEADFNAVGMWTDRCAFDEPFGKPVLHKLTFAARITATCETTNMNRRPVIYKFSRKAHESFRPGELTGPLVLLLNDQNPLADFDFAPVQAIHEEFFPNRIRLNCGK